MAIIATLLRSRHTSNTTDDTTNSTTTTTTTTSTYVPGSPSTTASSALSSPSSHRKLNAKMTASDHPTTTTADDIEQSSPDTMNSQSSKQKKASLLKAKDSNLHVPNGVGDHHHHHEHDGSGGQHHHRKPLSSATVKAITACGLYSFCSVSMILTNKSLASSYNHLIDGELNILLVVFQAVVAVICVEFSKMMGWVDYPPLTLDVAKGWAPVNLFFCGMLFTGMASLASNSVPMVTVFKNVTNILTTAGDFFFFGSQPEPLVLAAFGVMLFGAVAAAWNDITVTSTGLFWMAANCLTTSGYVLYMKHATQHVQLSKFGMVFVNNVLCVAFLLPAAFVLGEVGTFLGSARIHNWGYLSKNFWAGFVGFFLNFASLNCVQATGPTTYAIVGSLNKVPVAFLGYILFDSVITWDTWCYIIVSMCGGFLYSYAKIQSSRKARHQS